MLGVLSEQINPTYRIDPAFTTNKVFKHTPPPKINFPKLPLPEDWLHELEKLCCQVNKDSDPPFFDKDLKRPFAKHLESQVQKESLIEKLQIIYHRLQGHLDDKWGPLSDDDRTAILAKLSEEIDQCTDGFHNRVNSLIDSWQQPQTLDQLLYRVRKAIIDKIAATLVTKVQPLAAVDSNNFIYEIHIWNQTSIIASIDGLGVKANLPDDRYSSDLIDARITQIIRQALQQEFSKQFTPFHLPDLLIDELMTLIPTLDIERRSPNGIRLETREKITHLITLFLPRDIDPENSVDWKNYFKIVKNTEGFEVIQDLNRDKLYHAFYQALSTQNYFVNPTIHSLMDAAYCQRYQLTQEDIPFKLKSIILRFFEEKNFADLFHQLEEIKIRFPSYTMKLIQDEVLINIGPLIPYLKNKFNESNEDPDEVMWGLRLVTTRDSALKGQHILSIAELLAQKNRAGFTPLMYAASKDPDFVEIILLFLKRHKKALNSDILQQIFLAENKNNWNVFMIAASKQIKAIKWILSYFVNDMTWFTNILGLLFTGKSNNIAAPEKTCDNSIKNSIGEIIKNGDKKVCHNHYGFYGSHKKIKNVLLLALYNRQPETEKTIIDILDFIQKHPKIFNQSILRALFLEQDDDGDTALMLIVNRGQINLLKTALQFFSQNPESFNKEVMQLLFLEKNDYAQNVLMLAAKNKQPIILETILSAIQNSIETFSPYLEEMLLAEDTARANTLRLAAQNENPEQFRLFLLFLDRNLARIKPQAIHKLLFTKTNIFFSFLNFFTNITRNAVTAAAKNPYKIEKLLVFINKNSANLPNDILFEFFSEKELLLEPFFTQISSLYTFKNILHSLAASPKILDFINEKYKNNDDRFSDDEETIDPTAPLTEFLFKQLPRLDLNKAEDKVLINNLLLNQSALLLAKFDKKYFISDPTKLAYITDKLYSQYIVELKEREKNGPKYTTRFSFFHWRYSAQDKLKAIKQLDAVLAQDENRLQSLVQLQSYNSALTDGRLGKFLDAYVTITEWIDSTMDAMALEKTNALLACNFIV